MNTKAFELRTWAAAAAVLLVLGSAGCETVSVVEGVDFTMATPENRAVAPESKVPPGSTLKVQGIRLRDEQGQALPSPGPGEVSVEVKGGSYDAATGEVRFSANREGIPAEGYEVTVTHADGARATQRFRPDFSRIDGPEPEDVAAFDMGLRWRKDGALHPIPEGTALIPGEEYRLHAEAEDRDGRKFSSGDGDYPIPAKRLALTLTGFDAREGDRTGAGRGTGEGDGIGLIARHGLPEGDSAYGIRAAYGGPGGPAESLLFRHDPAIAEGPSPEAVAEVGILGELALNDPISPGAVKQLKVKITDTQGRSWTLGMEGRGSHLTNEFPLPSFPHRHRCGATVHIRPCHVQRAFQRRRPGHARQGIPHHGAVRRGSRARCPQRLCAGFLEHRAADGGGRTHLHRIAGPGRPGRPGRTTGLPR